MELNNLFKKYGEYMKYVTMQNNLIKARNAKRRNKHKYLTQVPGLEKKIEPSLEGFLEWGSEHGI